VAVELPITEGIRVNFTTPEKRGGSSRYNSPVIINCILRGADAMLQVIYSRKGRFIEDRSVTSLNIEPRVIFT
jgi:hypothetical protein